MKPSIIWCYLLCMLSSNLLVIGKSVHGSSSGGSCEHVKDFFDSINVTINPLENLSGKCHSQLFQKHQSTPPYNYI